MTDEKLNNAVFEANRFLKRVKDLKDAQKKNLSNEWTCTTPIESGSVRRSSLDLTRSLADLRKY